jgi:hypothetical protein
MSLPDRSHQPGLCWCGWEHTVSDAMINRARDLMCANPKSTTEEIAHTLFEDFHDLAKRDHVPEEYLRKMAMVPCIADIADNRDVGDGS